MNSDSLDKIALIRTNLIQSDLQSDFLTLNTDDSNLPSALTTKGSFDSNIRGAASNISTSGNIYYNGGIRENPKFTSAADIDISSLATYKWPSTTSATGFAINSSSVSTGTNNYNAFDKSDTTTLWSSDVNYTATGDVTPTTGAAQWISIKYPADVSIKYFSIQCGPTVTEAPNTFKIYGSADGTTWPTTAIKEYTNSLTWTTGEIKRFDYSTTIPYRAFKFEFTKTNGGTKVTIAEIKIFTHDSASTWGTVIPSTIADINFTPRLDSTSNPILALLNNLRICYNLLDEPSSNFEQFKNRSSVTVNKYSMTNSYAFENTDLAGITDAMTAIFSTSYTLLDPLKTSFVAIRRLLKAYEYIIHVYIAMNVETGSNKPITELILNKLNYDNLSLNDSSNTAGYTSIQQNLTYVTREYENGIATIDNLNIDLKDVKKDLTAEKMAKETNSNILNKNTIVYYVFLLLFIILICVLLYTIQKQKDEKSKIIVGGVLATSIVAMIIIYFLNMTYLKEGFMTYEAAQLNLDTYILEHLSDTVNISLIDNKRVHYQTFSHVVNKEIDRYEVINKQLKLEKIGTNDIQVHDYRNARILQYRVYLLLQILIILSAAMAIFLYTGENVLLFGVTLLLVLFMIYLYIMNTHGLVHTDARKIYWGQPSVD